MRIGRAVGFVVAGVAACGSGQIDPMPVCGDGVVDPGEACDDANLQDGDGCSVACELEDGAGFDCVELLEAVEVYPRAIANAEDGSVIVGGRISTAETDSHAWLGSFDAEGRQLWLREFMDAREVRALRTGGGELLALKIGAGGDAVLRLDAQGSVESESSIADGLSPAAMIETDVGVILVGSMPGAIVGSGDAWVGRLGVSGETETVLSYDHASLSDEFVAIERAGDRLMALGRVGVFDPSDGDLILNHIEGTILVEFDDQGQELERTFLMTDAEHPMISWAGYDLTVSSDGTWIVAGQRGNPNAFGSSDEAWAVGLREGEVIWTHTIEGGAPDSEGFPYAAFLAVEANDAATLVGRVTQSMGNQRVISRLDAGVGEVNSVSYEPIDGGFVFTDVSSRAGDLAAFVGHVGTSDGERLWRCNVQL